MVTPRPDGHPQSICGVVYGDMPQPLQVQVDVVAGRRFAPGVQTAAGADPAVRMLGQQFQNGFFAFRPIAKGGSKTHVSAKVLKARLDHEILNSQLGTPLLALPRCQCCWSIFRIRCRCRDVAAICR